MARIDPSIRHAITPPEFGEGKLHRAELVDRLHGEIPRKLVAIAAPAGYGKTSLLADFAAHAELPIVWVQVTEADQDLMRFISVLVEALARRFRRLRDEFDLRAYADAKPETIAAGIVNLLNSFIPETFAIILDDVHVLQSSPDVIEFLDWLIINLPEQITIIASGREVLEVSLAQLMAEGNLAGLGPHDLSLRRDEISDLLEIQSGSSPDSALLDEVYERTQGWVTGVILARYGANQTPLAGALTETMIYEYLSSVVLNRQPDKLRRFMLDASVLPVMTAEACKVVTGLDQADLYLSKLLARNLFISTAAQEEDTFVFHPMFREHLISTSRTADPERFERVFQNAAKYLKNDSPEIAIEMFLEMENFDEAAIIAEEMADELYRSGRYSTINKLTKAIPDITICAPKLSYYWSLCLASQGALIDAVDNIDQVLANESINDELVARILASKCRFLMDLSQYDGAAEAIENINSLADHIDAPGILGSIAQVQARYEGLVNKNYREAINQLERAIDCFVSINDNFLLAGTYQDQAMFYGLDGNLISAKRAALRSSEATEKVGSPLTHLKSLQNLSYFDYRNGQFLEALSSLEKARLISKQLVNTALEANIVLAQADIYSDLGLKVSAAELYDECLQLASGIQANQTASEGCLGVSILHRRAGNYRSANEWLNRAINLGMNENEDPRIDLQKAAIIHTSKPDEAIRLASSILEQSVESIESQIRPLINYFLACAYFASGKEGLARDAMLVALEQTDLYSVTQYIAAELASSPSILDWIENDPSSFQFFGPIANRIELMRLFKEHYSRKDNDRGGLVDKRESGLIANTLGRTQIVWMGEEVADLKPQASELLLMLIDNRELERDRIIEEFWAEHPQGRQTANLHMAIYSIRRLLGKESISLVGTTYKFGSDVQLSYDVAHFEKSVDAYYQLPPADPRRFFALTDAVNAYKGRFLPEVFSDWAESRRRELELKFLDVAAAHAEEAILRDQPDRALLSLRDALSLDPYRDDLNQRYMLALAKLERRSEAIRHYREYEQLLRNELGIEPAESIQALHRSVMSSG